MLLFVSYARPDRRRAESLATRLRQAGIDVWLDSDLVGGWPWWDRILGQLRSCDGVVAALSKASLRSQACRSEREYAAQLGKPILPITLEPMGTTLLPTDIARIQTIDYSRPDETAAFKLLGAIFALPKPPGLPNPLPRPPEIPESPFGNIRDRILAPKLDMDEQLSIIGRLEDALGPSGYPENRPVAAEMLDQMAMRPDLFANVARRIDNLQRQSRGANRRGRRTRQENDSGSGQRGFKAGAASGGGRQWFNAGTGTRPGGAAGGGSAGAFRQPPGRPAAPPGAISAHRGMAITAAIITFCTIILSPIGIAALVYSRRTKSMLAADDLAGARKASSRVAVMFWIAIGLIALYVLIAVIVAASHPSNSVSGMAPGPVGYSIGR